MAYQSLYRRRRPLTFTDMIGQEHITRTLSNALVNERLTHAYLFSGPRGTGKTTAAKIFARAMNCVEYPTADPCGKCSSCRNIYSGVSIDVIEMDAASNRGIDEIRELRERSRFASGESRFKVYIIDEAHMLTPEACNAFLKTLEEPPKNVVFILATTDPSKLPPTIVSRCQRFDFHLLTIEQIKMRLELILQEEGWKAESDALSLISRLAEGSLRDALGIMEQCSAYGDESITAEHVRNVTGAARVESIADLIGALVNNDLDTGLRVLGQVVYSGRDLNLFLRDLTFVFSRLLLAGGLNGKNSDSDLHGFDNIIENHTGKIDRLILLDVVELMHEAGSELRHAHFPQYILEINFIRLLRLLHGRLKPAEPLHVESFTAVRSEEPDSVTVAAAQNSEGKEEKTKDELHDEKSSEKPQVKDDRVNETEARDEKHVVSSMNADEKLASLKEAWPRIISELKKRQKTTAAWLEPAVISGCRGHLVVLTYAPEYQIHQERLMGDNHRKLVESVLSAFCGEKIEIKAEIGEVEGKRPEVYENKPIPTVTEEPAVHRKEKSENVKKGPSAEEAMEIFGGKIIDSD
ncbi:MAG: DNA polymerase III subunit gamma/tau [Bacillota bacterium]|nr:DNA polymerase III subunit gamma/tau [Bacillota bacterium]